MISYKRDNSTSTQGDYDYDYDYDYGQPVMIIEKRDNSTSVEYTGGSVTLCKHRRVATVMSLPWPWQLAKFLKSSGNPKSSGNDTAREIRFTGNKCCS